MTKIMVNFNTAKEKITTFKSEVSKYRDCCNQSYRGITKFDSVWNDYNTDSFMKNVNQSKEDTYNQISAMNNYTDVILEYYNNLKQLVQNNFNYSNVYKLNYDSNIANKIIVKLNNVTEILSNINNSIGYCTVPSDFPYKNMIDDISRKVVPVLNEIVKLNYKIASCNSSLLNSTNDYWYKLRRVKFVNVAKINLHHNYRLVTPNLRKMKKNGSSNINSTNIKVANINKLSSKENSSSTYKGVINDKDIILNNNSTLYKVNINKGVINDKDIVLNNNSTLYKADINKGVINDKDIILNNNSTLYKADINKGVINDKDIILNNNYDENNINVNNGVVNDKNIVLNNDYEKLNENRINLHKMDNENVEFLKNNQVHLDDNKVSYNDTKNDFKDPNKISFSKINTSSNFNNDVSFLKNNVAEVNKVNAISDIKSSS